MSQRLCFGLLFNHPSVGVRSSMRNPSYLSLMHSRVPHRSVMMSKIRKILHLMPSPHVAILIFLILIIFMYKVVNTLFSVLQICRKQLICSTSHRGERKKEDGCALLKLAWFGHDMFCTKRLVMPIIQQSAQQWRLGFNRVRFTQKMYCNYFF